MLHPLSHRDPGCHLLLMASGFLCFSVMVALWSLGMVGLWEVSLQMPVTLVGLGALTTEQWGLMCP